MDDGTIPQDSALYNAIQRAYKKGGKAVNIKIAIESLSRSISSYMVLYGKEGITDDVCKLAINNRTKEQAKLTALLLNKG